jgi:hypothetical protein
MGYLQLLRRQREQHPPGGLADSSPFAQAYNALLTFSNGQLRLINGRYFMADAALTPRAIEQLYFQIIAQKPHLITVFNLDTFRRALHALACRRPGSEDPMADKVKAVVEAVLAEIVAGASFELGGMTILWHGRPCYVITSRRVKTALDALDADMRGADASVRLRGIMKGLGWRVASLRVEDLRQRCFVRDAPPDTTPTATLAVVEDDA